MLRLRACSSLVAFSSLAATLALSGSALADALPPNDCTTPDTPDAMSLSAGQACNTAGPNFDQEGVCTATPVACCHEGAPGCPADAGVCSEVLCELVDAGAPTACSSAGGVCVGLAPGNCTEGHIGDANTYSCGAGFGAECCLPGKGPVDAGNLKDAANTTKDGAAPVDASNPTKDGGNGAQDSSVPADASSTTHLASSSGCAVSRSSTDLGDAAWFFGLGAVGLALAGSRRRVRRS